MDHPAALARLPEIYAATLRLRAAGLDDPGVAEVLGVPAEAVGLLIDRAEAKLRELLSAEGDGP